CAIFISVSAPPPPLTCRPDFPESVLCVKTCKRSIEMTPLCKIGVTLPRVLGSWARLVLFERQELALGEDSALAARQFAAAADLAHLAEDLLHDVQRREPDIDGG